MRNDQQSESQSVPTTPPNHQSPPTPDVTPPRIAPRPTVSHPPSERYPSSRTDSFRTAREHPYSSDEDDVSTLVPVLSSLRHSQVIIPRVPIVSSKQKAHEIGLGLGLEFDDESSPNPNQSGQNRFSFQSNVTSDFRTFDGEWVNTGAAGDVESEWDDNLKWNVSMRRPPRKSYILNIDPSDKVINDNPVTPTNATRRLREYPLEATIGIIAQKEPGDHTPTHKFGMAVGPIITRLEFPSTPDIRRFSDTSAKSGSTIIEAMVVEAPPQQQKTLRHRKKQLGLREFISDQLAQSFVSGSIASRDVPRRLVHKQSRIFTEERQSLNSSATTTSVSSSVKTKRQLRNEKSIPVVVVPERRSSMKSRRPPSLRSTSSRPTRSLSLNSTTLARPPRAIENGTGNFDVAKRRRRATSESARSSPNSQRTTDFLPIIPARRSSLSAPTSQNNSRATSLTAESLKAHNLIHGEAYQSADSERPSLDSQKDTRRLGPNLSVDYNGDPFLGSGLSAAMTPFSQTSYTTGTSAELSEAFAVQMFPHQNKSLLVIQQQTQPVTTSQRSSKTIEPCLQSTVASSDNTETPVTPPQPPYMGDQVDSPLRNPREPPQPPTIKFIPPTPSGLTSAQEQEGTIGYDGVRLAGNDQRPKRGFSLVRRALSSRRGAESIISRALSIRRKRFIDEYTQTSKGSINLGSLYPSVSDRPPDSTKLHPFWRPARFWDDLEGDEYDNYEAAAYPPIDNRPLKRSLTGSLKRTFAILPIRDDSPSRHYLTERRTVQRTRSGNLRVVKSHSNESLRRTASDSRYHPRYTVMDWNWDEAEIDASRRRRVKWIGIGESWRQLSRRISERRRERRNDKLRSMISGPRDPVDGVARIIAGEVGK
jgi:hypothetical protein